MSILFSPITLGNTTFPNRLVLSPMCQYSAEDGFANDWHLVHLGSRATGGMGLIIQEATAISPEGRISYGDLGIWDDAHIEKLSQIVRFIQAQGSRAGIQLAHAGRKASCEVPWQGGRQIVSSAEHGWKTVAPSPLPFREGDEMPDVLTIAQIKEVVKAFVQATRRAKQAGYDVVEIHAAHGYLLHQFYSPLSNLRTDEYGGSFENRIRLLLEVTDAVKQEWGKEKTLFVRLSATEWAEPGWKVEDAIKLAALLKAKGVHLIDTSSGGNVVHATIPANPGYQVGFAAAIRQQANIPTGAVGLITTPEQAEEILEKEQADMVFIGRESLRNPNFPLYAATALEADHTWPIQYERAKLQK
jgi:2,4-dienoyl-CoA reductase-like NADH-dependent reductase (Old Yellow Enzyme family)